MNINFTSLKIDMMLLINSSPTSGQELENCSDLVLSKDQSTIVFISLGNTCRKHGAKCLSHWMIWKASTEFGIDFSHSLNLLISMLGMMDDEWRDHIKFDSKTSFLKKSFASWNKLLWYKNFCQSMLHSSGSIKRRVSRRSNNSLISLVSSRNFWKFQSN